MAERDTLVKPFIWESGKNQTYDVTYGSQTLTDQSFDKINANFTLDAPENKLHLVSTWVDPRWSASVDITRWPIPLWPVCVVKAGQLHIDMRGQRWEFGYSTFHVSGNGELRFTRPGWQRGYNNGVLYPLVIAKAVLDSKGSLTAEVSGIVVFGDIAVPNHTIVIKDQASLNLISTSAASLVGCTVSSSPENSGYSLNVLSSGEATFIHGLTAEARSRTIISGVVGLRFDSKAVGENTGWIRVKDQASVEFVGDQFQVNEHTPFVISPGTDTVCNATIRFRSYTAGTVKPPFDFVSNAYPEGLFNFVTASGASNANRGKFMFQGIASGIQFASLLSKHILAVDGKPATKDTVHWQAELVDGIIYMAVMLKTTVRGG